MSETKVTSPADTSKDKLLQAINGKLSLLSEEKLSKFLKLFDEDLDDSDEGAGASNTKSESLITASPLLTPKIPIFSGDGTKDMAYQQWRYHVKCLLTDPVYEKHSYLIMQGIRQSLRGTAADVALHLGEATTPQEVLQKFDIVFGDVLTSDQLTQQFFVASQGPRETVGAWGCRLQNIVTQIQQQDSNAASYISPFLANKFWDGMSNDKIKEALRPKHESKEDFDKMFTSARTLEYEFSLKKPQSLLHQQSNLDASSSQSKTATPDSLLQKLEQKLEKFGSEIRKELRQFDSRLRAVEPVTSSPAQASSASVTSNPCRSGPPSSAQSRDSNPRRRGCTRCGYPSHDQANCVAKRDIYGNWLN